MKDEIKEINIPENVLVALGDLTNGALNYYKATETVKVKHNIILDYITNLQEENEMLTNARYSIDRIELERRIDKAIEYIKSHKETREHYEPYGTPMGNSNYTTTHIFGYYELLEILKGSDKDE